MRKHDLPSHVMAAGVLVWDDSGHVLMVQTHNRVGLILPGGVVEDGESPREAGRREVAEETGLAVEVTRLLVVEHQAAEPDNPDTVQFVFDSVPLTSRPRLALEKAEVADAHWLAPEDAVTRHGARGQARLEAALEAHRSGTTGYLETPR